MDLMEKLLLMTNDQGVKDRFAFLYDKILSENRKDYSEMSALNMSK